MRAFLLVVCGVLALTASLRATVDFNGTWVLDLPASESPDTLLKRLGMPSVEREIADSAKLQAMYQQKADLLVVRTKGPAFSRTEQLRLDGQPEAKNEAPIGPYTERTAWSADGKQLISTGLFRTKDGKNATLRVTRQLTDGTLVLNETLSVVGEAPLAVRRVWHRKS